MLAGIMEVMFETEIAPPMSTTRRRFLQSALLAGVATAVYGSVHARHEIEVVQRTIRIRNLPDVFVGFRLVQLSDIHLVEFTEPWFLQRAIDQVNALKPDLVTLTGDFISRGPRSLDVTFKAMPVCAELLSTIRCPHTYGVLGNHDAMAAPRLVTELLRDRGIPILKNRAVPIERGNQKLWLCGVDDAAAGVPYLTDAVPQHPDGPVLLMAHEPDFANHVRKHPRFPLIDLMLSGHSHGGQVRLPWIGPLVLPPMGQIYSMGHYQLGHMQLYVNRGLGTVGAPIRLNCPPEITVITLVRA